MRRGRAVRPQGGSRKLDAARALFAVAAALLVASACQSVLGIEELSTEGGEDGPGEGGATTGGGAGGAPEPGSGGSGPLGGTSMAGGGGGGTDAGAGGADIGAGGSEPAGAAGESAGGAAPGGAAGAAGGGEGGDDEGGAGGTAPTITVTGKVVDLLRLPMENVPVSIGGELTTTDANGEFTFEGVTPPYNLAAVAVGNIYTEAWLYLDLTRTNPTVQVYFYPESYYTSVELAFQGGSTTAEEYLLFAFGLGASGQYQYSTQQPTDSLSTSASWYGENPVTGTFHFLRWTPDTHKFTTYGEQPATLDEASTFSANLDLGFASDDLAVSQVTGAVLGMEDWGYRENKAYLAFTSGAMLPLYDDSDMPADFSYDIPNLTNGRVTLVALGDPGNVPQALAHRRGIGAGETDVELTLPEPAILNLPVADGTIDADTTFSWSGPDVVYRFEAYFIGEARDISLSVVTTAKSARIPSFASMGLNLPGASEGDWHVEYHGPYQSVDEAANPQGMIEPYDIWGDLVGIDDRDGVRSISDYRSFLTP